MTRARSEGNWRRCWPLLAILLALSFLGHDAALAVQLHGIDAVPPQHQRRPDLDQRGSGPAPDRLCDPDQGASLTSSSARSHAWTMQGTANADVGLATDVVLVTTPEPPTLSSSVRLALLQVFLI